MKHTTIFLLFIFMSIACDRQHIEAGTFYISNKGNDNANGRSPSTAWKTIAKVNSRTFKPGDSILFHAGDFWREELIISATGTPEKWIYYGSYGEGKNPELLGSEKADNWHKTEIINIWKAEGSFTNYGDDYYAGNIFFFSNDSISWGEFKEYTNGFTNLKHQYDWTINNKSLYIYCEQDPNNLYNKVEVTQRNTCVSTTCNTKPVNYIEFNGIDLHFGKRQGFFTGYPAVRGARGLAFRNMEVSYIGERSSGSAYGLAIWHSNTLIENCKFSDCGRRAISYNLYVNVPVGQHKVLTNLIVRNNIFKRGFHTSAVDISCMRSTSDTIKNIYIYNNYIDDSEQQSTKWGTSNQIFTQNGKPGSWVDSIYIVNNVFIYATARNILLEGGGKFFIWNNTIISHNPIAVISSPWSNVGLNSIESLDFRNNIVYDNLPKNKLENYGVLINKSNSATFSKKDYNLYFTANPGPERCFSAHRTNNTGDLYYWPTYKWAEYKTLNTLFEQHSPSPGNPEFINFNSKDFRLSDKSTAKNTGVILPDVFVTDPFGKVENITRIDILGYYRSKTTPSIGAYEYPEIDK